MNKLPHSVVQDAIYKHPDDWFAQLTYIANKANEIMNEQAQTIVKQRDELLTLRRGNVHLHHANHLLASAGL